MTDDLKPVRCGCGGEAKVGCGYIASDTPYMVYCTRCKTVTKDYMTEAEAITAWNRAMKGNGEEKLKAFWDGMSAEMKEERKIGKWVYDGIRGRFPACKCSICGHYENADWALLQGANYCPNCGAEMRGE